MRVLETMADLVADTGYTNGETVFVNGYHNPVLGGGGEFYYDPGDNISFEYDGLIFRPAATPANPNRNGRWKRINFEEVNAKFCGAMGNGNSNQDDGPAIQIAIDFLSQRQPTGGIVFIPHGTYYVSEIVLKNRVSIKGEFEGTIIKPTTLPNPSSVGTGSPQYANALVRLPNNDEAVKNIFINDLKFVGNPGDDILIEANMHCFAFNSTLSPNGGLWESSFKNIKIRGFSQDGIRFQGGANDDDLNKGTVNQFISFENVRVLKSFTNANSNALSMRGQNAQINFLNCTFSRAKDNNDIGPGLIGTNVYLVSPPPGGPKTSLINFDTCTFEEADLAFELRGVISVNIRGCWFENLNSSILAKENSIGVSISENRFSNAFSSNQGGNINYILGLEAAAAASFINNTVRWSSVPMANIIEYNPHPDIHYFGLNNNKQGPSGIIIFVQ